VKSYFQIDDRPENDLESQLGFAQSRARQRRGRSFVVMTREEIGALRERLATDRAAFAADIEARAAELEADASGAA
jgi:hypothetical protein